jgi:drug/metabolite transporter (DMT)-like permease
MIRLLDLVGLVLVGALWGCTNPLLRDGSKAAAASSNCAATSTHASNHRIVAALGKFKNVKVWLPYLLNQCGSLLYYFCLSRSNISLAVSICNALALVFSTATSCVLGERVDKPLSTALGASMIMIGVAICLVSTTDSESIDSNALAW